MGMAASQARFLSLTARKSNVEYQGQQVNQERTALANESSNLYSQLTQLDVPSPPSTSDYYKTVYSFTATEISGSTTSYTLDSIYSTPDGNYATLTHNESYFAAVSSFVSGTVSKVDNTEAEEESSLLSSGYQINIGDTIYQIYLDDASTYSKTLEYLKSENSGFTTYSYSNNGDADAVEAAEVDTDTDTEDITDNDNNSYLAYYMVNGTKYYLSADKLTENTEVNTATSVKELTKSVTEDYPISNYNVNSAGRTTSISVIIGEGDDAKSYTYDLDCATVQDEEAYEQAMLDYEYYQALYEKQVSDINAKTETIQQQDKTLELELKQLDTEQNAISTEMDAVQKVIEDNIDSTFNTFG